MGSANGVDTLRCRLGKTLSYHSQSLQQKDQRVSPDGYAGKTCVKLAFFSSGCVVPKSLFTQEELPLIACLILFRGMVKRGLLSAKRGSNNYSFKEFRIAQNVSEENRTVVSAPEIDSQPPPNVLLVGVDSMSRLNMIRQLNKTYHFLTERLGVFEFHGYNKVADNTFVNVVPLLTGKFVHEVPSSGKKIHVEKYEYMWKEFSKAGYLTLLAEDHPQIATFNYLKPGFPKQPTDYYLRPFSLAMSKNGGLWNKYFDNTILFFFGDHGMRWGALRNTYVGKMEERLPMLLLYLPPWFKSRYPQITNNVHINAHRLTTPFDVYYTLKDIASRRFDGASDLQKVRRGFSLFGKIPLSRTCEEAEIAPHWCTCQSQVEVHAQDKTVIAAAKWCIEHLNRIINSTKCAVLHLKAVNRAWRFSVSSYLKNKRE
ncbi:LOW QUALITY PROTEIN: uncharacterized protein LOC135470753 [Liolophura sinensis]|uniref:LOW QUALITY PROTEIN: uncharacterized protein LOC135470753 n=1 Tax=Liolophura sinensis TaxID=3198878 RepID=UPI003158746F